MVDTFTINWGADNNWWCPPVALIPRVIAHAQTCSAGGTLIVSEWKTSPLWPVLHPAIEKFADSVLEIQELLLSEFLILPGVSETQTLAFLHFIVISQCAYLWYFMGLKKKGRGQ